MTTKQNGGEGMSDAEYMTILDDVAFKAGILHTNTAIVGLDYLVLRYDYEQLGAALHRYYQAQRTHAQPRLFSDTEAA
jgi:hypothetical protein